MTPTVCVFNRTRESFLCLSAIAAGEGGIPAPDAPGPGPEPGLPERTGFRTARRQDGIWLRLSSGTHGAGSLVPVDRVYLDAENRVVQLVEHLDRSRSVEVRGRCASVLEVRTRTIFCSRTRVGDELLICSPEEVEAHWRQIQEQGHGEKQQEMIPCSKG